MRTKTKIVNLFGGPGSGKSTTMAGVFSELKLLGYNAEFVAEYAKDVAWEQNIVLLQNQVHVFAEQFRRQWRLIDNVDYIITDSPLLLSSIYYEFYLDNSKNVLFDESYRDLSIEFFDRTFEEFNNINFMINRKKDYVGYGRVQTEEQAKEIDQLIRDKLNRRRITYIETDTLSAIDDVLAHILSNQEYYL